MGNEAVMRGHVSKSSLLAIVPPADATLPVTDALGQGRLVPQA